MGPASLSLWHLLASDDRGCAANQGASRPVPDPPPICLVKTTAFPSIWDLLGPGQTCQKHIPICLRNISERKKYAEEGWSNEKGRGALFPPPSAPPPACLSLSQAPHIPGSFMVVLHWFFAPLLSHSSPILGSHLWVLFGFLRFNEGGLEGIEGGLALAQELRQDREARRDHSPGCSL